MFPIRVYRINIHFSIDLGAKGYTFR